MNDNEKEKNLISLDNCDFSNPSNRLSSPRSLEACYRLGIQPSELYQISLEDFKLMYPDVRSLPKDLQDMRYEANEKFRNDSIDQVKEERSKIIEEMEKKEKDKQEQKNNANNTSGDNENTAENSGDDNKNDMASDEKMEKLFDEQKKLIEKIKKKTKTRYYTNY